MVCKKGKGGAKTKLTPTLLEKIIEYVRKGAFAITACQAVGIDKSTFCDWNNRGQKDIENGVDSVFAEFSKRVKEARAEAEIRNVEVIQNAARDGTWQAAAWYLERTCGDRYLPKHKLEHSGSVNFNPKVLSDEELEKIASGNTNEA